MKLEQCFDDIDEFISLEKEQLEKLTPASLHSDSKFEYAYCRDGFHGKKQELIMRYVLFENMNISNLNVNEKTIFNNCVFENVKLKKCKFSNAVFVNCKFVNSSIVECSLPEGKFVNCIGLEETQFVDNILSMVYIIGSNIDEEDLENNSNQVRDIIIKSERYQGTIVNKKEETRMVDLSTLPCEDDKKIKNQQKQSEEEEMEQDIISKKMFEDKFFTEGELKNKLFDNCNFLNCTFDVNIHLKANTDFIKCNFENMIFPKGKYDKLAFDQSSFNEVIFQGDFIRCNFARCSFENSKVDDNANFFTCNFDFSNAYEQFSKYQNQFTDVLFNVESKKEVKTKDKVAEIYEMIKPLYVYMKTNDSQLQHELEVLREKEDITDESIDEYLLKLNDIEFMQFISRITLKRTQESVNAKKIEVAFTDKKVI